MNEFRTKLGENGRIVIPASCRKLLHLEVGEELIIRIEDHELRLISQKHELKKIQSLIKRHAKNQSLVDKLLRMRKEEKKNE